MKSKFKDAKDWNIVVWGDWRTKDGKPSKYRPDEGLKEIHITGGEGMYWFFKEEFDQAIECWLNDLELIKKVENEEKRRIHKGLFYYQIGRAYELLGFYDHSAKEYYTKAYEEDKKSYGEFAKTYLAYKLLKKFIKEEI